LFAFVAAFVIGSWTLKSGSPSGLSATRRKGRRVMTETSLVNPPSTTATLPPTAELLALSDTELGQRIDAHHDAIEKQKKIPIRLSMIS
jgi:hypothetical protein